MAKNLAVFDFDHTVVDGNTDVVARKLLKNEQIPESIRALHHTKGWTIYMQEIFRLLKKYNVPKEVVKNAIVHIPPVRGLKKLISTLATTLMYDIIIISDSNTLFIDQWLIAHNMKQYIHSIFTNPAEYNSTGLLEISGYHFQTTCNLSTVNLCKGMIMEDFIKAQKEKGTIYDRVVYVGDGKNDFCPILRLKDRDVACPRAGYPLEELMQKNKKEYTHEKVLAEVLIWQDGDEILSFITK